MFVESANKKRKNSVVRDATTVVSPVGGSAKRQSTVANVPVNKLLIPKAVYENNTPFLYAALFARETAENPYKGILGSNEDLAVITKSLYSTTYGHFESYFGVQCRALKVKLPKMHDFTHNHLKGIPTQHTEAKKLFNGFATFLLEVTWMETPGRKVYRSKDSMEECVKT